jgi:hypothetical protein
MEMDAFGVGAPTKGRTPTNHGSGRSREAVMHVARRHVIHMRGMGSRLHLSRPLGSQPD